MDDTRNPAELKKSAPGHNTRIDCDIEVQISGYQKQGCTYNGQQDIYEEVCSTTPFEEDSEWRKDDSEDDLANVSVELSVMIKGNRSAHRLQQLK